MGYGRGYRPSPTLSNAPPISPQNPPPYPYNLPGIDVTEFADVVKNLKRIGWSDDQAWSSINYSVSDFGFNNTYSEYSLLEPIFGKDIFRSCVAGPAVWVNYNGTFGGFEGALGGYINLGGPAQSPPQQANAPGFGKPPPLIAGAVQATVTREIRGEYSTVVFKGKTLKAAYQAAVAKNPNAVNTMEHSTYGDSLVGIAYDSYVTELFNPTVVGRQWDTVWLPKYDAVTALLASLVNQCVQDSQNAGVLYGLNHMIDEALDVNSVAEMNGRDYYNPMGTFPTFAKAAQMYLISKNPFIVGPVLQYHGIPLFTGHDSVQQDMSFFNGAIGLWVQMLAAHRAFGGFKLDGAGQNTDGQPIVVPAGTVLGDGTQLQNDTAYYRPVAGLISQLGIAPEKYSDLTGQDPKILSLIMDGFLYDPAFQQEIQNTNILAELMNIPNFKVCYQARLAAPSTGTPTSVPNPPPFP